jgi:hypothetical protein
VGVDNGLKIGLGGLPNAPVLLLTSLWFWVGFLLYLVARHPLEGSLCNKS